MRTVYKELRAGLDANRVPANWHYVVDHFIEMPDGSERAMPDTIPLTAEEVAANISQGLVDQEARIAADRDEFVSERAALAAEITALKEAAIAEQDVQRMLRREIADLQQRMSAA